MMSNQRFDVAIIGAGISGLAAAARLAKNGAHTLLIERTQRIGGRCSFRHINGCDFDIGALYIGSRVVQLLQSEFDLTLNTRPILVGVRLDNRWVTLPPGRHMLFDLLACGVNPFELSRFCMNLPRLFGNEIFEQSANMGEVVEALSGNRTIRETLFSGLGVSGVSPYQLPARNMRLGKHAIGTLIGNPLALEGGNIQLAERLYEVFLQSGGQACLGKTVQKIQPHESGWQIVTGDETFLANAVISTIGVKQSILELTEPNLWPGSYQKTVATQSDTLKVVNLFIQFSSVHELPDRYTIYFLPMDVIEQFRKLEQGEYPQPPMFVLQVPGRRSEDGQTIAATLQFYHPRNSQSPVEIDRQVDWVLHEGLERLASGLSRRVISCEIYAPDRYEGEFGLQPYVFAIAPVTGKERLSVTTPQQGFFLAGDSVEPGRPSVPQAFESGLLAANAATKWLEDDKGG